MEWPKMETIELASGDLGYVPNGVERSGWRNIPDRSLVSRERFVNEHGYVTEWTVRLPADKGLWKGIHLRLEAEAFEALRALCAVRTDSALRRLLERFPVDRPGSLPDVVQFTASLPAIDVRPGDLLLRVRSYREEVPIPRGGRAWTLQPTAYEPIRAAFDANPKTLRDLTPWNPGYNGPLAVIADRRKWGLRAKTWTPKLRVWRAFDMTVSEPIVASSEAAAIFELLSQVHGRVSIREEA